MSPYDCSRAESTLAGPIGHAQSSGPMAFTGAHLFHIDRHMIYFESAGRTYEISEPTWEGKVLSAWKYWVEQFLFSLL